MVLALDARPLHDFSGKLLFLLRHASAESDAVRDHARPLAGMGLQEAKTLGQEWKNWLPWPAQILCSDAVRTQQTLQQLCRGAGEAVPDALEPELYDASPTNVISLIHRVPDTIQHLLCIGHNPTIHQLAAHLTHTDDAYTIAGKSLMHGYAPCTLTVLSLEDGASWGEVMEEGLRLRLIHRAAEGWLPGKL
jgi:phosphohistidine phosphatase